MKLTRSQLIVVIVLGVLTVGILCCLLGTVVRNLPQFSQVLVPAAPTLAPPAQTQEPTIPPTLTASPVPAPTPTPTPIVPQTRYDLQVAGDPENPALRVQRGYAYIALGAYDQAIMDFDIAIGLDGTLAEAHVGRGEAAFHLKEWSVALKDFERALALNPDLASAHAWRGYLLSERGEYELALAALRQAVVLDDADPWKRVLLAQALLRSGNPEEAQIEYTTVLSLEVRSVEAHVGRALAQAEQRDFDGAQADLDVAQDIAPYDPVALNGQAWFYAWYRRSHLAEAEQLAQRALARAEDDLERARYLDTLGWVYYRQKRYEEALAVLEEATALATIEGEVVYGEIVEHLEEVEAAR